MNAIAYYTTGDILEAEVNLQKGNRLRWKIPGWTIFRSILNYLSYKQNRNYRCRLYSNQQMNKGITENEKV